MRRLAPIVGAILCAAAPAGAAGVDSRAYTCAGLQSLIAAQGFVFISAATFGDFAVASTYYCGGGDKLETRSVATSDNPECSINYCNAYTSGKDN